MTQTSQVNGAKRTWRKVVVATSLALLGVASVGVALAMSHGEGHMHGMDHGRQAMHESGERGMPFMDGRMLEHMLDTVKATDEQRAKIHKIVDAAQKEQKDQRDAMRALHEKTMQLLAAPKVDEAGAESLRKQAMGIHDKMSKLMLQTMIETSKVLTPEQRATLAKKMRDHQARMDGEGERCEHDDHLQAEPGKAPEGAASARP